MSLTATDAPGGPGIQEITYSATGAQAIATTTRSGASAQLTFSQEGQTVLHYFATNNGNVSEPPHDLPLNIDVTAPVVQYTGNQGVYGLLDTVHITCTASDALSCGCPWP